MLWLVLQSRVRVVTPEQVGTAPQILGAMTTHASAGTTTGSLLSTTERYPHGLRARSLPVLSLG